MHRGDPCGTRSLFDDAGVMIVNDASANKCGVLCSSYEIASSMLLRAVWQGSSRCRDQNTCIHERR